MNMKKVKPFTWVVALTIDPTWVADGFSLSDERAHEMLAKEIGGAYNHELKATVLVAPAAVSIAAVQGYKLGTHDYTMQIRGLRNDTPNAKAVPEALLAARALLDSVAFVATEGDTKAVLALLAAALDAIEPRQGKAVEMED